MKRYLICLLLISLSVAAAAERPRLRDLGIVIGALPPGPTNSLTDVPGVQVGHQTLVEGDSTRTGVTVVKPHGGNVFLEKVPAAVHVANGFGKFVGTTQIDELGVLETPIALTNTLSTFATADALVRWTLEQPGCEKVRSVNPVVGECNDGYLNDIRAQRVDYGDVLAAIRSAHDGQVVEGCVGAGTGVRCMGFKGGIGSSSRRLSREMGGYTIGVLVQTNFGGSLTVAGAAVGRELQKRAGLQQPASKTEHGSCIVIVATDAPLDARRLRRLAARAPLGLAAVGSPISHGSGDYVLAFSTAENLRTSYESDAPRRQADLLRDDRLTPLFQAVRDATEEAVINSLLRATTMSGHGGRTVEAIDPEKVIEICKRHRAPDQDHEPSTPDQSGDLKSDVRTYGSLEPSVALRAKIDAMESRMSLLMFLHNVPGVAIALIENRKLVWARGYGVRCAGTGQRVDPDTVMEACSMSKPFFSYALLKLVQQKRFDLDQRLVDYLGGDYHHCDDSRHRQITARMVLTHTSGLPNWREGGWRSDSPLTLGFDPGTKFRYSGEGFLMLQRSLEKELETDLDSFMLARLIEPLGLKQTRYVWNGRFADRASCGHDRFGQVKAGRRYGRANAAFTLYTSAEDYARFLVEILRRDRTADHSVSDELLLEMLTAASHREEKQADWGLAWGLRDLDGQAYAFHSGANGSGFRCYSEFFPASGDGLVIMTNALGGDDFWRDVIDHWHTPAGDVRGR